MADNQEMVYLFADGKTISSRIGPLVIRCYHAGQLSCPSGKIVACDAGLPLDGIPFDRSPEPGRYKVQVTMVCSEKELTTQIAYVTICIDDSVPATWIQARPRGYGGDNSVACVMDIAAASEWNACFEAEGEQDAWARLVGEVDRDREKPFANFVVDAAKDLNMIAWMEDGDCGGRFFYGLDSGGKVVCIAVDTMILKEVTNPCAESVW
jgi:hypothetical protein